MHENPTKANQHDLVPTCRCLGLSGLIDVLNICGLNLRTESAFLSRVCFMILILCHTCSTKGSSAFTRFKLWCVIHFSEQLGFIFFTIIFIQMEFG